MKKILILGLISSLSAFSMSPVFKMGADYTMYSTAKLKNETGLFPNLKETEPKNASAYSGVLELGYLLDFYGKNIGISIEPGFMISSGYGKYERQLNKEQQFIPTYIGIYLKPSFGYKFNDNFKITIGGYASVGALVTHFMKYRTGGEDEKATRIGFTIPFGGTIGLEYKNFIIQFNGGVKYLFAEIPQTLKKIIDEKTPDSIKDLKDEILQSNPLTYDIEVSKNGIKKQNKFTPSFGITMGFKIR